MKIPIIVMFRNIKSWTKVCLEFLEENTSRDLFKLIVIDNGSLETVSNEIKSLLKKDDVFIRYPINLGVSFCYNDVIKRYVNEKYFIILHNDCLVPPEWLENILNHANNLSENGIEFSAIFPRTNYLNQNTASEYDNDLRIRFESLKLPNKGYSGEKTIRNNIEEIYRPYGGYYEYSKEIKNNFTDEFKLSDELCVFCTLFKTEEYIVSGGLDEDFLKTGSEFKLLHHKITSNKGIYPFIVLDTFVHHNGNTTSDSLGENFVKNFNESECILKRKIDEFSEEKTKKISINTKYAKGDFSVLAIREKGIGDIIMSCFSLSYIKKMFPNCNITYMANRKFLPFLKNLSFIDNFVPFPKDIDSDYLLNDEIENMSKPYEKKFDLVLNWIKYVELIDKRNIHRIIKFMESIPLEGIEANHPEFIIDRTNDKFSDILPSDGNFVVISPNGTCPIRSLPKGTVLSIVEEEGNLGRKVVLLSDRKYDIGEVDNLINLSGCTELEDIPNIIDNSIGVYSPDSGMYHIAGLMGVPCKAFFGSIDPKLRCGYYKNSEIFTKSLICSPCGDIGCNDIECMNFSKEEIRKIVMKDFVNGEN